MTVKGKESIIVTSFHCKLLTINGNKLSNTWKVKCEHKGVQLQPPLGHVCQKICF